MIFAMGAIIKPSTGVIGGTMATYRCVLLTQSGKVKAIEEIVAITNGGALTQARTLLRHRLPACVAFELWSGDKMIHREPPEP
jgi:hypothetical protein